MCETHVVCLVGGGEDSDGERWTRPNSASWDAADSPSDLLGGGGGLIYVLF